MAGNISHVIKTTHSVNGGTIGGTETATGNAEVNVAPAVPASTTNQLVTFSLVAANAQELFLLSAVDLTVKTNSPGVNEVQSVAIAGAPTGGTFTLTYSGQTTAAIAWNAAASAVQTALVALSNVGSGQMVCTGGPLPGTAVTCTFGGTLAATNVAQMTATNSLTGGSSPAAAVTTTTGGVSPGNTWSLKAGIPLKWTLQSGYFSNPISADITALYVTNATASATTFYARALSS
jgi:hypothetical protein